MKLIINGRLISYNKMQNQTRANKYGAASTKKAETEKVAWACKQCKLTPINEKVDLTFYWYRKNRYEDPDNISSAQKFILDGLQKAGIIDNDGWNHIGNLDHRFRIDKERERVEVEFTKHEDIYN